MMIKTLIQIVSPDLKNLHNILKSNFYVKINSNS